MTVTARALRVELLERGRQTAHLADGALLWRAGAGWRMVSSAVLGGGLGERE